MFPKLKLGPTSRPGLWLCVVVANLLLWPSLATGQAAHVYITQNGAGLKDGSSLANAGACDATPNTPQATCAFFNNAANWGAGAAQIGAGTIVHLSGTITAAQSGSASYLQFQGSGAAGTPITLLFDADAVLQSPAFWVAININSQSYITVDGGANGIIQNTANGTSRTYHQSSQGIHVSGAYYVEIKNLTIKDIYNNGGNVNTATDVGGAGTQNIRVDGANGSLSIHHNTLSAARTGVDLAFSTGLTHVNVYANTVTDHCWGIRLSEESAGSTSSNLQIYGNTLTGWSNWQWPSATYHTDGIITYGQQNSTLAVSIYNNYIYGDLGAGSPTAFIFCTYGNAAPGATCNIFNNLLVASGGSYPVWIKDGRTTNQVYNNTIVGPATTSGKAITLETSSTQATIKNNIVVNFQRFVKSYNAASTQVTSDRNVVVASASPIEYNDGAAYYTWAQWQALSKDANSSTVNPSLDANYKIPSTASSAYQRGENLSALAIAALNLDRSGTQRPGTGAWDAGVYQFGAAPVDPNAINVIQAKFCGPQTFDPTTGGKCTISATAAGNMLVVAYGSYNSAGSTPVISSITDNGGTSAYQQAAGARAINTAGGQTSWNDLWYAANVASGITELTIKTSTSQTGDVFIWEVSNVNALDTAGHLDSQAASLTPVSPSLTTSTAKTFIAAMVHPQPGHAPTGIHSGNLFTSDAMNDGMGAAHYTASSAGSYQAQWDLATAGVYASLAAAFKWAQPGQAVFDQYGGLVSYNGVAAPACHSGKAWFWSAKIGNRWVFCTPDGHPFVSMNVSYDKNSVSARDCQTNAVNSTGAALTWTQYDAVNYPHIYQATGVTWTVRDVLQDGPRTDMGGSYLAKAASLATMTAGSYFQVGTTLYVWMTTGDSPAAHPKNNYPALTDGNNPMWAAKYGNDGGYNMGYQELRRMQHWGFNSLGQNTYGYVYPTDTCTNCSWPVNPSSGKREQPIKWPYILVLKFGQYGAENEFGHLPVGGAVKDTFDGFAWTGYNAALLDMFDPNLGLEVQGEMKGQPQLAANSPWVLAITTEDSDYTYGWNCGPDFKADCTGPNAGYTLSITSPMQTFTRGTKWQGSQFLYDPPYLYSKMQRNYGTGPAHGTCSNLNPCTLRDYLYDKYSGNMNALNDAWGSYISGSRFYTSFDSSGTCVGWDAATTGKLCPTPAGTNTTVAETIGTGNGTQTAFTYTLAHFPVSPYSIQISMGGTPQMGDCPWFFCTGQSSGYGALMSPALLASSRNRTFVAWAGGVATYTFLRGMVTPAVGAKMTVTGFANPAFNVSNATITAASGKTASVAMADPGTASASATGNITYTLLNTALTNNINYATGAVTLNFAVPPPAGAAITIRYVYGGWGAGGTGVMDESAVATHTWVPPNLDNQASVSCLSGADPEFPTYYACDGQSGGHFTGRARAAFEISSMAVNGATTTVTVIPPLAGARTFHSGQKAYITGVSVAACNNDPDHGAAPITVSNASDTATTFTFPTPAGCTSTSGEHAWVTTAYAADLDAWNAQFSARFFKTMRDNLRMRDLDGNPTPCVVSGGGCQSTEIFYMGLDNFGGYSNRYVLQGALPYVDGAYTSMNPSNGVPALRPDEFYYNYQFFTRYSGDIAILGSTMIFTAQNDSSMFCYDFANTLGVTSQEDRGRYYYWSVDYLLNTPSANGTHQWVAFNQWFAHDIQYMQQGLMSVNDNAYDGIEARKAKGTDRCQTTTNGGYYDVQAGFQCGGEPGDYGNFINPGPGLINGHLSAGGVADANQLWMAAITNQEVTPTVNAPTFLPAAGTYDTGQNVAISTTTAGATICYTSDGSTPTADGAGTCTHGTTLASGSTVLVSFSQTLKAIATAAGYLDSGVATAVYAINPPGPSVSTVLKGVTVKGVVIQ